ncbi:MAG: lysylphosphatidylglycerol synthase transmembrane domain-containing protein [Bacteroidales bacterium]
MEKNTNHPAPSQTNAPKIQGYKIIIPILLGLGVVIAMFWNELYPQPKLQTFVKETVLQFTSGDTLQLTGNKASANHKFLSTNVNNLSTCIDTPAIVEIEGEAALRVIAQKNDTLSCVCLQEIELKGGEEFSIEGSNLQVPNILDVWKSINIGAQFYFFIFLALLFMLMRDFGYIWRIRLLSDGKLSWKKALRIIVLWEFTSAVTPSAVGGTSIAILYVNKEGISLGRSSAIVMATSFLDEIYFILMFPLLLLVISTQELFTLQGEFATGLMTVTFIGYSLKFLWILALSYGLFINPKGLRWLIMKIFTLPLLRKWKDGAAKTGDDIVSSAAELRYRSWRFWARSFSATFISWTSRYWVVNALFLAFFAVNDHLLIFARQLVMWIMMLVSPTPGGSGFAEFVFKEFLGEFIPSMGLVLVIALLWRLITYYLYLLLGVFVLPQWLKSKWNTKKISR